MRTDRDELRIRIEDAVGEEIADVGVDCDAVAIRFKSGRWVGLTADNDGEDLATLYHHEFLSDDVLVSAGLMTEDEYQAVLKARIEEREKRQRQEYERLKAKFGG